MKVSPRGQDEEEVCTLLSFQTLPAGNSHHFPWERLDVSSIKDGKKKKEEEEKEKKKKENNLKKNKKKNNAIFDTRFQSPY